MRDRDTYAAGALGRKLINSAVSGSTSTSVTVTVKGLAPSQAANLLFDTSPVLTGLLPSGAGHDAMKLHQAFPQAMLFVRGGNAGISHNPLETITADDAHLCVEAFQHVLQQLASELSAS